MKDMTHEQVLDKAYSELKDIFENSHQAIYLYLDDSHKICNKKFSDLLGYKSEKEWSSVNEPFTSAFVDQASQSVLVHAYRDAVEKFTGSMISVTWKTKKNMNVNSKTIIVPVSFGNHVMALHFVS